MLKSAFQQIIEQRHIISERQQQWRQGLSKNNCTELVANNTGNVLGVTSSSNDSTTQVVWIEGCVYVCLYYFVVAPVK